MELNSMDAHFQDIDEGAEDIPVNRTVLQLLAKHANLEDHEMKHAYKQSELYPSKITWLDFANRFFLAAGVLLLLSGVVLFFTQNWEALPDLAKLGLVEASIIGIGLFILFLKPSDFIRKLGITAMSMLVGIALITLGIIYPSGSTALDFMLGWAVLISAWVFIADFSFLWLFYLWMVNAIVFLFLDEKWNYWDTDLMFFLVALINSIALGIWEYVVRDHREDWAQLFCIRIITFVIVADLTMAMVFVIFDFRSSTFFLLHIMMYLGWVFGGNVYYINKAKDIAFTALIGISILIVGNSLIIRALVDSSDPIAIFFFLSIINIVVTIFLVRGLMKLNAKWNAENDELNNSIKMENNES